MLYLHQDFIRDIAMSQNVNHYSTASQLVDELKDGTISAIELHELYHSRYLDQNQYWNAVHTNNFVEAKHTIQTKKLQSTLLAGLPVTIKDGINVKGMPSTGGMFAADKCIAKQDAILTSNVKNAGAVIIGKTNTSVGNGD